MKIAFVSGKLRGGGSERAVAEMAGYWAERGHNVGVITYLEESGPDDYPLHPGVTRVDAFSRRAGRLPLPVPLKVAPRLLKLRRAIRVLGPDVVISMILGANLSTLIATMGVNVHVIGEQVNAVEGSLRKRYMRLLQRALYHRLDHFVVLTEDLRASAAHVVTPDKIHVIPRHVSSAFAGEGIPSAGSRWSEFPTDPAASRVVAMGRLVPQKGFDLLLHAIARVADSVDVSLIILGEGEERSSLEHLARRLGIEERVWLAGWTRDPRATLVDSTVFVLSSRWEGWCTSLLQAMALGLPVVAADCVTGPRMMITDGVNGILVPPEDPVALATATTRVLVDPELRDRLASAALEVRQRFAMERVMAMWDELLPAEISIS